MICYISFFILYDAYEEILYNNLFYVKVGSAEKVVLKHSILIFNIRDIVC